MFELYQTEWCPASHRVRQRLTELGIDFVARQVHVAKEDRAAMRDVTGDDTIPALVVGASRVIVGEEEIEAYLQARFEETPESEAQREKAARAWRRQLEEAAPCLTLATH
jgi:glutathione S-transferase